jgi:hypothetical protein
MLENEQQQSMSLTSTTEQTEFQKPWRKTADMKPRETKARTEFVACCSSECHSGCQTS